MGGWKLEVGKMAMYMAFPVTIFYFFNQPEYFETWVKRVRQELYPPLNLKHKDAIESTIKEMQQRREDEMLKALEHSAK